VGKILGECGGGVWCGKCNWLCEGGNNGADVRWIGRHVGGWEEMEGGI